jgi:eukaryotic-like serine/threonine-protein kinase
MLAVLLMPFTPPTDADICRSFPELRTIQYRCSGGFKAVYLAQTAAGTEAFKLLCLPAADASPEEQAARREHLARATREIELLGRINLPDIVRLGSIAPRVGAIAGVDYLGYTEEWLEGHNLWHFIRSNPPLPVPTEAECRQLLISLLRAIQALWQLGVVHRDIKPLNVMKLALPERPFVLLDLGIAYDVSKPGVTYNSAIRPGTLRYFAPEMANLRFRDRLDFRSDLYTAGLTVFEYAAHRHPIAHDSDDNIATLARALNDAPRTLKSLRADISDEFCNTVDQLLKKQPILRPGNLALLIKRMEGSP